MHHLITPVSTLQALLLAAVLGSGLVAQETDSRLHSDGKGWGLDQAKIVDAARPRVLLIGDSILSGYHRQVIKALDGKAYVDVWITPLWQSEQANKTLAEVLTKGPYDVVHFNMGLHGWPKGRIKEGTYEPLTKAYIAVLREKLPKAKLIWASSTPTTMKGNPAEFNPEVNPTIVEHNAMAAKVMAELNIPVNDFYALLEPQRGLMRGDGIHWTPPAYKLLAAAVVTSIENALVEPTRSQEASGPAAGTGTPAPKVEGNSK